MLTVRVMEVHKLVSARSGLCMYNSSRDENFFVFNVARVSLSVDRTVHLFFLRTYPYLVPASQM